MQFIRIDYENFIDMTKAIDSHKLITNLHFRKWTFPIVQALGTDTKRYSTLLRLLPEVTQKVLTEHLRQLERTGIVRRFFYPTIPPRVEYKLTEMGVDLLKLTKDINLWVERHHEEICKSQKAYDKHIKQADS